MLRCTTQCPCGLDLGMYTPHVRSTTNLEAMVQFVHFVTSVYNDDHAQQGRLRTQEQAVKAIRQPADYNLLKSQN